ncbi:MAG: phosphorylcholine transferase LicD [Faecalispora jeddahensis]|jgi:lipopolysaccharide cholinephosphotransferase
MDNHVLRRLQLTQLEILKVFDQFCRQNDLKYSLYAGSLLGAVRHKAFIPWDDDLDVCMSRNEYESFIKLWKKAPPPGYILQNKENTPSFCQSFSKIRKDHTTFLQEKREGEKYHTGIFLDVFPLDRIPNGKLKRMLFKWHCMEYQLLTREFAPPKAGIMMRLGSSMILACTPEHCRDKARQNRLKKITQYKDQHNLDVVAIETMASLRQTFAPDMLDTYVDLPFEDGKFMCFAGWDDHLRRKYGNYMQLPPEEERTWRHHPVMINFDKNYSEIMVK